MIYSNLNARELRRKWKPHKERLSAERAEHPTNIRFHRACSWLQQAESTTDGCCDILLINHWVAFNSLYSQWNHELCEPVKDYMSVGGTS